MSAARLLAVVAAGALPAAPAPAAERYSATPAEYQPTPTFTVTYSGRGTWRTRFRGTPPNPGGHNDRNVARDSGAHRWRLRFSGGLTIPECGGEPDPCATVDGVSGARGVTAATARIDHRHVDGLYPELHRTVRCTLRKRIGPRQAVEASLQAEYDPAAGTFGLSTTNPLATVLSRFPTACPRQGDSIDRVLDNYAIPGFSFADGYGPERWFASGTVAVPADVLHRSSRITIRLADTRRGTPPRGCAVEHPSYERCSTGGSWSGVLTLARR